MYHNTYMHIYAYTPCQSLPPLSLILSLFFYFSPRSLSLSLSPHSHASPGKTREIYIPPMPPEDEESIFVTMDASINYDKCDEIPVEVIGRDPPQMIQTFNECNFYREVYNNVKKCRYHRPTPVQKYAIPIIMAGRDIMACAQTGSGKTVSTHLIIVCAKFS